MPRALPPFLNRTVTRHGRVVYHVRRGKGARLRLRAAYDTPEFWAEYRAALEGQAPAAKHRSAAKAGSLAWLIERYRETAAWTSLSLGTRRQREAIFRHVIAQAGEASYRNITRKAIAAGRDRRRDRPAAARHFVQTLRGLFGWAVEAGLAETDPTQGIAVARPRTAGHRPWTEAECARFEAHYALGTRERLAFDVLLYTGLRRGDAVRLGRPHVAGGVARLRAEKNGEMLTVPILPALARSLAAGPVGELTFIAGDGGRPLTKESFGNWFARICRAAGVQGRAHGLRKIGAQRAAEAGATEAELEALFGWGRGSGMAALYTRAADRERLAALASAKLAAATARGKGRTKTALTSVAGAGASPKKPN